MEKINAVITGVGGYVPDYVLTNDEISRMVDTNDEWIMTRIGVKERHILNEEGLGSSYMARKAAKQLMKKTGANPDDIDLIHVHHPVMIGNVATRIGKEFHIPVVFTYHTRYEQYLHYLTPFGYLQNKANQGNLLGESILDFAQRQVIQRY